MLMLAQAIHVSFVHVVHKLKLEAILDVWKGKPRGIPIYNLLQ